MWVVCLHNTGVKGKGFPYSISSIGPWADPDIQAVSPQVTISHPPGGRLPLLYARSAVTFLATEHHHPWPVPSYTAWWENHIRCEQLAQGCYADFAPSRIWTYDLLIAAVALFTVLNSANSLLHYFLPALLHHSQP